MKRYVLPLLFLMLLMSCGGGFQPVNLDEELFKSIQTGESTTVRNLLKKGADVNAVDNQGISALQKALEKKSFNIVQILVSYGADMDIDINGETLLIECVKNNWWDTSGYIIKKGADVNGADANGWTPLMFAAANGFADVAERLVTEFDADITLKNKDGKTALDIAKENKSSPKEEVDRIIKIISSAKK